MTSSTLCGIAAALALTGAASTVHAATIPISNAEYGGTIALDVDATDLDRRIFRVKETLPVKAGAVSLYYPRWLPGNHGPRGPIPQFAGLMIQGNGQRIEWLRDLEDPDTFHIQVPRGVTSLSLEFEFLSPTDSGNGRVVVTPDMLNLQWNTVLLYPAGYRADRIQFKPSVALPAGWKYGTALEAASQDGASTTFKPVSLEQLVDSPMFAGRHFMRVDLDPEAAAAGRAPIFLDVVADRASQLVASPEALAAHKSLVVQADKLYGTRHYAHYDMLLAISDNLTGIGLEHHQSSENGVKTGYFVDWTKTSRGRDLLPHEYTHSWNGKYRRPADLATPHFNVPMHDTLLWVYEGQTQFWGSVLAARSGMVSQGDARDDLAITAASLQARAGRAWRNLQDTTNEAVISGRGAQDWRNWQRSGDYYEEMRLVWLEADMTIREASNGQRSMDDFARGFLGAQPGKATADIHPLTYTFADVVAALNKVQPMDWGPWLRERLDRHDGSALLDGIRKAGWQLSWSDTPSAYFKSVETRAKDAMFSWSLGFDIGERGKVQNVGWDSPAFKAGMTVGGTLLAVDGREYKPELLKEAVTAAKSNGQPIELLVKTNDVYKTFRLDYHDGLRYPSLTRIEGTPDRLALLFAPK